MPSFQASDCQSHCYPQPAEFHEQPGGHPASMVSHIVKIALAFCLPNKKVATKQFHSHEAMHYASEKGAEIGLFDGCF